MQFSVEAIGFVRSSRSEAVDDDWDSVRSYIELEPSLSEESLAGLADFSHIEVLYYFHKVDKSKIVVSAEHPRENEAWPKVGIFAQRKRARPNLVGATIVKLERIEGRRIFVKALDAIDGTPVLDIKPVFAEYLPRETVTQPAWSVELMRRYW